MPEAPAQAEPTFEPSKLRLSLQDLIDLVKEKNERIMMQQLEWAISREAVNSERAIFEPEFTGSYQHEKNRQRNTVEEAFSRGFSREFNERNNDYDAALDLID